MARVVYVPELGRSLSFQDGATDQQISSYLKSKYSGIAAAPAPAPATAPKEAGSSGPLGAFVYSAGAGLASIPEGIEGLFSTEEEVAKSQAGKNAQAAREALQYLTGYDPTKEQTTAEFLAGAAGSLAPILIPGSAATKVARLAGAAPEAALWAGRIAAGTSSVGLGSAQRMETIRQQKAAGMSISPEEALASQRLSGLISISDLLPVAKYLGPIADIFSKVPAAKAPILEKILQNRLANIAGTGAYEGVQEVGQGILDDINEYGIYNPDVQIGQDVLSNAAGGAFAGSLLEGVVQVATGRKLAPYRQLQQDLATERMENSAALRQGRISQAAENLRQSGITGPLDVVPEEIDGLPRYLIKTPEGQSIAEFVTQDDATKAIDLYKNSTGADVMVREDIKAPEVFPVEIGNQKFNNIDEIKAARDKAVATRKGIEKHITDPALLNRNATERGVSEEYYTQAVQKRLNVEDAGIKKLNDFLALAEPKVKSAEPVVRKPKTTVPEASPKVAEALSTPAVAQEPTSAEEPVSEAPIEPKSEAGEVSKAAGAIVDNMYLSLWDKVRKGQTKELGKPSAILQAAKLARDSGGLQTIEEFKQFAKDAASIERGPGFQVGMSSVVERYSGQPKADVAAEEEPIGARGFPTSEIVAEEPAVAEAPIEEPAAVEVPKGVVEEVTPPENAITTRPDATPEQLTDLQQELFGAPIGLHNMTPEQKATYEAERDKRFPPVPLDNMSAGPTTGVEPLRVTPRIGTAFGEVNLKPEVKAVQDRINSELNARLRDIAPPTTSLQTQQFIDHGEGYLVHGTHNDGVINIALGIYDPKLSVEDHIKKLMGVLNHETIHAVRNRIRPSEWKILSKAVENTKIPGKKYTYLDKAQAIYTPDLSPAYADPDAVIEEAVAEMYKDWYNKQQAPNNTRGLFNRITEILRRVFRVLKSSKYEDVFKSIEAGQMRDRDVISQVNRGAIYSASPTGMAVPGQPMSNNINDRERRAFGLYPYLRTAAPRYYDHSRMILGETKPNNAAAQIANLDTLLARHPNTLASNDAFADYLADAQGKMATQETGVPIIPYKAVEFANNPALIARQIGRLTPGQLAMADSGLSEAIRLRNAYMNGSATPVHTAKLILWGILSRGVSPFVQESMFLDVVAPKGLSNRTGRMAGGIDPFIMDAIEGNFDLNEYMDYVRTLKIDGLPGAGTTHNLGAFGKTTLTKLQQRVPDGRTLLQYLHDLISDYSLSGKEVRRRFHEVNPGIGINNKVLSFALLVSGRDDVLVLDRVQMRNQFNDGRFNEYNLYDGEKIYEPVLDEYGNPVLDKKGVPKVEGVADAGTGIAHIGDGVFGLMYYEALERDLAKSVRQAYNMVGRGNQFSMGRYHWESWVASSAQEVDHGSVSGLIKDALGENDPYGGIYTGEGKYDTFNSGIKYGYTNNGEAYVALPDGLGRHYYFTPEYAKKVISGYDKRSTGIISDANFKVSTSTEGPWYDRPEVNKQNLRRYLDKHKDAFYEQRRLSSQQAVRSAGKGDTSGPGPGPVHVIRRIGGVRQVSVGDAKSTAKSIADKYISKTGDNVKFSAAPALDTDEFKNWFKGSKIVNRDGTPRVVYHGTDEEVRFTAFNPNISEFGTHFGMARQANEFATIANEKDIRRNGRVFPVYLSIKNPLRLVDYGSFSTAKIAPQLLEKGIISRDLFEELESNPSEDDVRVKLREAMRKSGYDGIVYLNRAEGLNKGSLNSLEDADLDWQDITDQKFKAYIPEAEDSYIIFDPRQAKSVLNEFKPGEANRLSFSAAPLPTYLEQQNQHIFAPVPNVSFKDMVFDFFGYGQNTVGKTLNTQRGTITISDKTMRNISRRMNVVDRNAYIAHLEKLANEQDNPGQFERMVADDSALAALVWRGRASHVNASMIIKGKLTLNYARPGDLLSATMKVEDDPDSLLNISKILLEPGPVGADGKQKDKREVFKMYATAKRAIGLKADGKPLPAGITDQYIRDTIPFVEQSYPEVAEAYRMYQRFNKNLMTTAVNAGIISQQELADLTKRMDYYGYYREAYQEDIVPTSSNKTASRFNLREYKGSQRGGLINDPLYVMLQNSHFWVDSIAKNIAATKSFNLLRRMDEARILQTGEKPNRDDGEEDQVMFFMDKGVLKRFAVKDPMLAVALGSDDRIDMGSMMKWLSMPTHILRESVTRDPGFMFANLARDTMSTWITSGESIVPFIDTVKGFTTALKGGASFQELMGRGVVGSYDLGMKDPKDLAATIARRAAPKNIHMITNPQGLINVTQSLWDKMGSLSEASDAATRVAVYEAARAQGMSEAEASLRAIEIMDFSRHGSNQILSVLTKLVPFLNARIQGIDVLYQAAKAGGKFIAGKQQSERDAQIGKRFLVRGGILAVISMALEMLNEDDEDYRGLEDYIKNSNVLIPLKHFGLKGEFIAIPKPFEAGLLFSTFPQQFYKSMQGDATTRENIGLFTSSIASTFGVNPIPQLLLPGIEVLTNHDFYTGLPLIPEGKSRLAPELQYNASTSSLAMLIGKIPVMYNLTSGKFEGISPIVIDNLIGGYGGPLGTYISQAVSIGMETASVGPERLPQDVTRLPIVRRFFIDAESKNPKVVSQAYELFGLADEANRSFSRLRQMGDVEATMAYVEENKDILSYKKYIFKLVDGLNKISARERAIERDGSMTRDEKFAAMKNLRDMKIQIATKVAEINKVLGR